MQLVTNRNSQSGPIAASDSGRVSALPPPQHSADEVLLWNVKEVALALGLGVRTVWRLSSSEQLPTPISVGRCKRWERRAIEAYVARRVAETKGAKSKWHHCLEISQVR